MWIKTLIKNFFNISFTIPTPIFEDNHGAIELANNQSSNSKFKTKHMDIKIHFIKKEIELQNITLKYIKSVDMLAEFLTKPLGKTPLLKTLKSLNLCSNPEDCEQRGMLEYFIHFSLFLLLLFFLFVSAISAKPQLAHHKLSVLFCFFSLKIST